MTRIIILFLLFLISGCQQTVIDNTLRDYDLNIASNKNNDVFIKPKSDDEIRHAYEEYLKYSSSNDKSRISAISRLAELEFKLSESLLKERDSANKNSNTEISDKLYDARLTKTIELLEAALHDFPNSKNNDKVLYQLAKAYEQKEDHDKCIKALEAIVNKYPKSPYFAEAEFRLGEDYFSKRNYLAAELAYSAVLSSRKSGVFHEKALYKRGWSRYKQDLYTEALDDYIDVLTQHDFDSIDKLNKSEKDLFDEYFRSVSLTFSNLGGADSVHDYFKNHQDFKYIYYTYYTVSNSFLKQERYSDAAETLQQFIKYYPDSSELPSARVAVIDAWKMSGFDNKLFGAIDEFYKIYNPDSKYWVKNTDTALEKRITQNLKDYTRLVSTNYHNRFQKSHKSADFEIAESWYLRYFKYYTSHSQKDDAFYLYAELLNESQKLDESLKYYELAAYDNEIILKKEAAYATITITDKLIKDQPKRADLIARHIKYALLFSQQYTSDPRTNNVVLHAAELAFATKQYAETIRLSTLIPDGAPDGIRYSASILMAQSFYELKDYQQAERIYTALSSEVTDAGKLAEIRNKLALSIYQQAEILKANNNILATNQQYARISDVAPQSEIAPTALYNAIALAITNNMWQDSILYIKKFQNLYPHNKYNEDVSKKLSVAYLKSGNSIEAAHQFTKIAQTNKDAEVRMAALWQAAELYEEKKNYASAIRSYTEYADTYKTPYSQYLESAYKLTVLYSTIGDKIMSQKWNETIISSDSVAARNSKSDRTKYIASLSSLALASASQARYENYKLVVPLAASLKKKKAEMLKAVNLYGQASTYGVAEIVSQSAYSIGKIYSDFSVALLNSEKPANLNPDELEQYKILLEDQAFPFEEKSIEFHETNIALVKDGVYNEWINKSHVKLKELFPVRYNREAKVDAYINVFN